MKFIPLLLSLFAVIVCRSAARHAPIDRVLDLAEVIAHVRVTSVTEDLHEGILSRRATLSLVGRSHGLPGQFPIEVTSGVPSKFPGCTLASDSPLFLIGEESIVLLKKDGENWTVLRQIQLSEEGKVEEPEVFRAVGFDRGADARYAVGCLIAAKESREGERPAPPVHAPGSR